MKYLKDHEEAEDTVQEVFAKLWKKRDQLDELSNVESFAMVSVKNLCIDKIRKNKNRFSELNDNIEYKSEKDQLDHLQTKDIVDKVIEILDELPEQQKEVFRLRDIEDFDFEEIAQKMELNVENVRVIVSRARKKIRKLLFEKYNYKR